MPKINDLKNGYLKNDLNTFSFRFVLLWKYNRISDHGI